MTLLPVLLHPATQLLFILLQVYCLFSVNLVLRLVLVALSVVLYIMLTPNTRRGSTMWGTPAEPTPVFTDREKFAQKHTPIIVISYSNTPEDSGWRHALAFRHRIFEKSVVMVVGAGRFGSLPLARFVLWFAGGLMPYTRGALINLLRRKAAAQHPVIVVSQSISNKKVDLSRKGPFAAALKCGASILPAIVLADGKVVIGTATDCTATSVPTSEEVVATAKQHAARLRELATAQKLDLAITNL